MNNEFEGKVVVVTGSSGIGLGAALKFAREGGQVHVGGIDESHNAAAREKGRDLEFSVARVDVSDETSVAAWIDGIGEAAGGIDILVNAAAVQTYGDIETTDSEHWDRVMAVNLRSCFLTAHHAYPYMKPRGQGSIVHVSSVQGFSNQFNVLAYATTKGAIHALTRAMAVDCAKDNIRVNSVSPGSIRTPLLEFAAEEIVGKGNPIEDTIAEFGKSHPLGRVGTIEEVSELIAYLAGDRSGFCTGGDYRIDGGLTAQLGV